MAVQPAYDLSPLLALMGVGLLLALGPVLWVWQRQRHASPWRRQQALDNMLSGGLRAAGVTNPVLQAGVQAGVSSDNAAMKAMQDYLAMMARMNTPQASAPAAVPAARRRRRPRRRRESGTRPAP
jgi:hypothetical protein